MTGEGPAIASVASFGDDVTAFAMGGWFSTIPLDRMMQPATTGTRRLLGA
jgi:hypothetical protein